jgi:hypothetical protein
MFFRRVKPREISFEERLDMLKQAGFTVQVSGSRAKIMRDGIAAVLEEGPDGAPRVVERAGIAMGDAIGVLVDGGFQKFFRTPDGRKKPALADELKAIHNFQEGLRERLDMVSLYNESLGTVSTQYLYDRVENRDRGVPKRPWE